MALVAAPAVQAQGQPGADQYVPRIPSATGDKDARDNKGSSGDQSSGSADDQALDRITGGGASTGGEQSDSGRSKRSKKDKSKQGKQDKPDKKPEDTAAVSSTGSGDDDDDDGALASVGSALTDWDDPVVPGLVALAALLTLGVSIAVLVRRRRTF
jgi:hypothetical protein